jgi:hypothetical protein
MSTAKNKRRISQCYHHEVKRLTGDRIELRMIGDNSNRARSEFNIVMTWGLARYLTRALSQKWQEERAERIAEITRCDNSFPSPPTA